MKIHEYNEMMAHLTRRRLMSNGGKVPRGFVDGQKFANLLIESGFDVSNIKAERGLSQSLSRLAELYDIEKILGPGNKFYYKVPSKKNLEEIIISRAGPKARIPIAKKLIKDLNIKSQTQLAKAMKDRGYAEFSADFMKKNFPEIKGVAFSDPKFVPPMKKDSPRTVLNQIRYDLRKTMSSIPTENFLRDFKKAKNYGSSVQTMHTTAKEKKTGLINIDDLAFGSKAENEAYAQGLDRFRSGLVTTLSNIKNKFSKVKPNEMINVPVNLQTEYNFPKKMKLKELVDRINVGLTDLAFKTDGKVRGELLEINNKGMKFVDNPIKNYKIIPGGGLLKGTTKKFGPLLKKFRVDEKGTMILDEKGSPVLKKGQTLTQSEAEKVFSITETMKQQLPEAAESRPVSLKEGKSFIKSEGPTLGSTMIQPELANLDTPAARNLFSSAGKIALGELGFAGPSVVLDTYAGLTPAEMALNVATFGFGTPIKDSVQKRKYIADAGFGSDYSSALTKRRNLKTAPEDAVGQLTDREKQAIFLANAFDAGLDLQRAERAADYQRRQQSQLKRGELEIPDYTEVPEATTSIQPEFQEETTETRSLPFGLDRLLPFDDEDEII